MPLLTYSALRLGLLALALVVLWAVGLGGWLLVLVGTVVAWGLSYVLLPGPRDAAALWLAERTQQRRVGGRRFGPGIDADADAEDAEADGSLPQDARTQDGRPQDRGTPPPRDGQSARPRPSSTP